MSRSRLMRSHSTDGLLRRTPTFFSDRYDGLHRSSACLDGLYEYDSEFFPQHGHSQKSSTGNIKQKIYDWQHQSQRQPAKQHRVTWGAMPKYSSERDRLFGHLGKETSTESTYSRSRSPFRTSNESCCPIHGYSRQGHSNLNRNELASSVYHSQLYPPNSGLYRSQASNRNSSLGYYQSFLKPFTQYNFETSRYPRMLPSRYSSLSYLQNPELDLHYYPSYGSLSRDQVGSMQALQSSLQRRKRPKWQRSILLGLHRLSLHD